MSRGVLGSVVALLIGTGTASAQIPADIAEGLKKIGQIVDPACTAKLYRPLMPKNDYNTYWPPDAAAPAFTAQLYPGVTLARDQSFGPNPKDVVDIFSPEKGGGNRPIFIYIPGGAGNKIEQQAREGNAFYDNIGRWAVKNGMIGVTIQRHPGVAWDDPGRDIANAVDPAIRHSRTHRLLGQVGYLGLQRTQCSRYQPMGRELSDAVVLGAIQHQKAPPADGA